MKELKYVNIIIIAISVIMMFCLYSFYYKTEPVTSIGSTKFNLIDEKNQIITEKSLLGKYSLIMFGFSRCPHICPEQLKLVSEVLKNNIKNLQAFFITLDPENDNVKQLANFHTNFNPKIKMLTGEPSMISKVSNEFKVYVEKSSDPEKFNHSAIIYLLGPNGKYVTHFTPSTAEELYEDLKKELHIRT